MFFEARHSHKLLERGFFHSGSKGKTHVVINQGQNLFGVVVGETQAAANFLGHLDADINMPIETNAVGRDAKGGRFADIMQERAPGQRRGTGLRQFLEQEKRVYKDIALRMKLRRLLHPLHGRNLRQDFAQQSGLVEQQKSTKKISVTVQIRPDEPRVVNYLTKYFGASGIRVYWGTAREFVNELKKRWDASPK